MRPPGQRVVEDRGWLRLTKGRKLSAHEGQRQKQEEPSWSQECLSISLLSGMRFLSLFHFGIACLSSSLCWKMTESNEMRGDRAPARTRRPWTDFWLSSRCHLSPKAHQISETRNKFEIWNAGALCALARRPILYYVLAAGEEETNSRNQARVASD
jgi:hypothetical protein